MLLLPGPMPADDNRREAANNERCRRVLDEILAAMVIQESVTIVILI